MILRSHVKGDAPSTALYSECEIYRYALTRVWDPAGRRLLYIMLNPSKATEVTKWMGRRPTMPWVRSVSSNPKLTIAGAISSTSKAVRQLNSFITSLFR